MISLVGLSEYFEKLCRQNKRIAHTEREKRFFRMNRDVSTKFTTVEGIICVIEAPEFVYDDNGADNYMKDKTGAFSILKRVKTEDFIGIEKAVDECEKIAHQFVAVMRQDNRNYNAQLFGYLPLNNIHGFKVGPVFDGYYGIRTEFKFGDNVSMCVDQNEWDFNKGQ